MSTNLNMETRLWDYIDGSSQIEEKNVVEQLIATQAEWRAKYHELLEVQQLLSQSLELDEPSMRFSQNVMEEIARYKIAPATKTYINKKIIYGIGGFFILMILGFLVYGFGQINWSDNSGTLVSQYTNKVNWSRFFSSTYTNIFLMLNAVTGLMLLDLYLNKRRKELHSKEI
jgi:hypothetical protein